MIVTNVRSGSFIDRESLRESLRFVRPRPYEFTWQAIPWQTSIPEAIDIARNEGKPILLWAMNGNPLTLT